jgi:hypothetical protein
MCDVWAVQSDNQIVVMLYQESKSLRLCEL